MSEPYSCEKQYIGNFGHPVWENPTEHMVNAAFAHHGLRWQYVTYEVPADNLRAAFEGVKALGYRGFNCTLPHKVAILEHLDGLGASAEVIGAVNCVVRRDGRYIEQLGTYDPMLEGVNYSLDLEKVDKWISVGAQPSVTVNSIIRKARKIADAGAEA